MAFRRRVSRGRRTFRGRRSFGRTGMRGVGLRRRRLRIGHRM